VTPVDTHHIFHILQLHIWNVPVIIEYQRNLMGIYHLVINQGLWESLEPWSFELRKIFEIEG
jgi:hypothetical protein